MNRTSLLVALALAAVATTGSVAQAAVSQSCVDYRRSIIDMEKRSVRPAGWLEFDGYLRSLYQADCIDDPGRPQPQMYWYRTDGTRAAGPPGEGPGDDPQARFATTEEHAAACRNAESPSICALVLDAAAKQAEPYDPATKLPPLTLQIGGKPYAVQGSCLLGLETIDELDALDDLRNKMSAGYAVDHLRESCPDLLQALIDRTGVAPSAADKTDGTRDLAFARATVRLAAASGSFVPGGRVDPSLNVRADPGFQRMCQVADSNMNLCRERQGNMRSVDTQNLGKYGQAGAFDQCAALYGRVLNMCRPVTASGRTARTASAPSDNGDGALRAKLRQSLASANPDATGGSRPPPQNTAPAMSDQCQALVQKYIAAAQANDGPRAVAGYKALKQAGGCRVLAEVEPQAAPAGPDPRFLSRGSTPMLDQTVLPCDQQPERCAQVVDQLKAGTSPEAVAALYSNAIGIGLQLGTLMGRGMLNMQQANVPVPSYAQPNMHSLAPAPVRSTYGQGSPVRPSPPSSQSTITGLGQ